MKIAVLNGSPKGKYSTTLQSTLYLEKLYKEDQFEVMNRWQQGQIAGKRYQSTHRLAEKIRYGFILLSCLYFYCTLSDAQDC